MELKRFRDVKVDAFCFPFNRTSMELKHEKCAVVRGDEVAFNRTSMELKPRKIYAAMANECSRLLIEPVWN